MNQSVYNELQNVQTRDELALVWKYFSYAARLEHACDWGGCVAAFKARAEELGIEWKGK